MSMNRGLVLTGYAFLGTTVGWCGYRITRDWELMPISIGASLSFGLIDQFHPGFAEARSARALPWLGVLIGGVTLYTFSRKYLTDIADLTPSTAMPPRIWPHSSSLTPPEQRYPSYQPWKENPLKEKE